MEAYSPNTLGSYNPGRSSNSTNRISSSSSQKSKSSINIGHESRKTGGRLQKFKSSVELDTSSISESSHKNDKWKTPGSISSKSSIGSRSGSSKHRVITPRENITGSNVLHGLLEFDYISTMFSDEDTKENVENFHALIEALQEFFLKKKLPLQTMIEKKQSTIVSNATINQLFGTEKGAKTINAIREYINTLVPAIVCT
jgi:hypothetical protein